MISNGRLEANRQNALKSTGPKTVEGKAASRLNAVKHGLSSQSYVLDDDFVERRTEEWGRTFHPSTPREEWVVQQMARASVRIDLCQVQEFAQRGRFRAAPRSAGSRTGSSPSKTSPPGFHAIPRTSFASFTSPRKAPTGSSSAGRRSPESPKPTAPGTSPSAASPSTCSASPVLFARAIPSCLSTPTD